MRNIILCLIGLGLIIVGHGMNGAQGLGTMLLGLTSLIGMLYLYNRKYR